MRLDIYRRVDLHHRPGSMVALRGEHRDDACNGSLPLASCEMPASRDISARGGGSDASLMRACAIAP